MSFFFKYRAEIWGFRYEITLILADFSDKRPNVGEFAAQQI